MERSGNPDLRADLQLLATNLCLRRRYDSSLYGTGSIRDWFNQPFPVALATFVERPSRTAAVPNLHFPTIVVGWNRKRIRKSRRCHHSAKHSDQKDAHHFSIPHNPLYHCPL